MPLEAGGVGGGGGGGGVWGWACFGDIEPIWNDAILFCMELQNVLFMEVDQSHTKGKHLWVHKKQALGETAEKI